MDINTISIIVSIIVVGFLLERRINSRLNEIKQDILREMDRRFGEHGSEIATMRADISELQKGQARVEGALEIMKDLFERAMFSSRTALS